MKRGWLLLKEAEFSSKYCCLQEDEVEVQGPGHSPKCAFNTCLPVEGEGTHGPALSREQTRSIFRDDVNSIRLC